MSRNPVDFLEDIEESCIRIMDYTEGLSRDEGVCRQHSILGDRRSAGAHEENRDRIKS
jgi:hypothetical protein